MWCEDWSGRRLPGSSQAKPTAGTCGPADMNLPLPARREREGNQQPGKGRNGRRHRTARWRHRIGARQFRTVPVVSPRIAESSHSLAVKGDYVNLGIGLVLTRQSGRRSGEGGACPDRTRAIPCKVRAVTGSFHDPESTRNDLDHPGMSDRIRAGRSRNSLDCRGGLRSCERAHCVPDEVVDRGLSRLLPDNTAGIATWLDAREPSRAGDLLLRKRSAAYCGRGQRLRLPRSTLWWSPNREAARPGRLCQMSGGVLARLRPDPEYRRRPGPAGRQRPGSGSPGAWHARAAWATMPGWLVMTAGRRCS